jgi:cobalamin biosynthesis protein CobD/CbiB
MDEDIFGLFIGLVAVLMVSAAVLIPIIGLTARYAFGSWIDRLFNLLEARQSLGGSSAVEAIRQVEQRLSVIEHQLEATQQELQESVQRNAFYERLIEPQLPGGTPDLDTGSDT